MSKENKNLSKTKLLIKQYFKENSIVQSSLDSFNYLLEEGLQKIVDENKEIMPSIIPPGVESFKIRLGKIRVEKPTIIEADGSVRKIYPQEARLRNLTYAGPVFLEMHTYINDVHRETVEVNIGNLPIMVKSKNCHLYGLNEEELIKVGEDPLNPGGYFIINGKDKVIIITEELAPNKFSVEKASTGPSKYVGRYFAEGNGLRIPHKIEKYSDGVYYITFSRIKKIPIVVLLKALGIDRDEDIVNIMNIEDPSEVIVNLYEFININSREEALDYIAKKIGINQSRDVRIIRAESLIDRFLFPNIGQKKESRVWKAYQLIKLWKRFILVDAGVLEPDDKDHFMNKRLRLPGELMGDLFRLNLRILINDMLYNFQRILKRGKLPSIRVIVREKLLTERINSAMATGNWVGGRTGICQRIEHVNYIHTVSHLQRVVSPLSSSQENFEARSLHPTHIGRLCPTETPEGTNIGLRKNLAMLARVSTYQKEEEIIPKLTMMGLKIEVPYNLQEEASSSQN